MYIFLTLAVVLSVTFMRPLLRFMPPDHVIDDRTEGPPNRQFWVCRRECRRLERTRPA